MEGLMNLDDQIVDSEVWQQLSMDSIGECSNCSMLSLDAEALRVFENEESGWHTVGAPPDSTVPCSGSSSNSSSSSSGSSSSSSSSNVQCENYKKRLLWGCERQAQRIPRKR